MEAKAEDAHNRFLYDHEWNQGFMETVQSDMEEDLKKVGATEIHSYGFID